MQTDSPSPEFKIARPILFVLYLIVGLMVFFFGANTFSLFPTNRNLFYEWGLAIALLVLALLLRRSARLHPYWEVAYALFIAAFANALNRLMGNWLGDLLPPPGSLAQMIAIDKLSQAVPIVLSIIVLTLLAGNNLGSIFLQKGHLRQGLTFGFISFGVFAAIFAVLAVLQANAAPTQGLTASGFSLPTLLAALPWMLVFVFANAFMEELWFRGISLRKLVPFLGAASSVILTALIFGGTHLGATYVTPLEMFIFPAIVFAFGLVNGFAMLKTDSIWGSVLFHAGYDLLVIIPVLASME